MNLYEKLASEISRVTALRCQYESMRGIQGVNVEPAMLLMSAAIEGGIGAAGRGEVDEMIEAVRELEGFSE